MTDKPSQPADDACKPDWPPCNGSPSCLSFEHDTDCPGLSDPKPPEPYKHSHADAGVHAYCPACIEHNLTHCGLCDDPWDDHDDLGCAISNWRVDAISNWRGHDDDGGEA